MFPLIPYPFVILFYIRYEDPMRIKMIENHYGIIIERVNE